MNCHALITTFIADYIDGTLPPETLADFEHHLDVCASCVAYLRSYRTTIALAEGTRVVPENVPEELVSAILATLVRK
jgi:anti-sigma factor RsiW